MIVVGRNKFLGELAEVVTRFEKQVCKELSSLVCGNAIQQLVCRKRPCELDQLSRDLYQAMRMRARIAAHQPGSKRVRGGGGFARKVQVEGCHGRTSVGINQVAAGGATPRTLPGVLASRAVRVARGGMALRR